MRVADGFFTLKMTLCRKRLVFSLLAILKNILALLNIFSFALVFKYNSTYRQYDRPKIFHEL